MNIKIDGDEINRVKDFMLLGAISVEIHIRYHITLKIFKNVGVMHKLSYYLLTNTIESLYYTLGYPYID